MNEEKYYGEGTYEAIRVIQAWELSFCLGNVVKYISRAGKKNRESAISDLTKAKNYLDYEIQKLKLRTNEQIN